MKNVIVDTNVIIDVLTKREPWCMDGERIFLKVANEEIAGNLVATTVTDIYYLLRKYIKDTALAKKALGDLLSLFRVLEVTGEDCINALASPMSDYEDAVLSSVAVRHNIDLIVTRNVRDFKHSRIEAVEPSAV